MGEAYRDLLNAPIDCGVMKERGVEGDTWHWLVADENLEMCRHCGAPRNEAEVVPTPHGKGFVGPQVGVTS